MPSVEASPSTAASGNTTTLTGALIGHTIGKNPDDLFRPYGFLPGHFVEWAKLLCTLDRHAPADWHVERAAELFADAVDVAWDDEYGGLQYTFDRSGAVLDDRKYYRVTAEQLAAAALLAAATDDEHYAEWYDRTWRYAWEVQVDPDTGVWYRLLDRDGARSEELLSPPNKTDYHPISAMLDCYRVV